MQHLHIDDTLLGLIDNTSAHKAGLNVETCRPLVAFPVSDHVYKAL